MRIIGHRGARGEAPENTLGGFRYLHQLGGRAVEFDVRQLQDDQLIVIHDDNLSVPRVNHSMLKAVICLKLSNLIIAINGRFGDLKNTHLACPM